MDSSSDATLTALASVKFDHDRLVERLDALLDWGRAWFDEYSSPIGVDSVRELKEAFVQAGMRPDVRDVYLEVRVVKETTYTVKFESVPIDVAASTLQYRLSNMQECNMVDIDGLARELDRFSGVDNMAMCDEADTEALTFQVDVVRS
jgi:hypothetical protein